jgi:peptidoglycan hydrolase-like protein with peptidoglycan-binding domain
VRRLAAGAAAVAALLACNAVRRVEQPAPAPPKPEEPDRKEDRGVPPRAGRPRVPAAPEALLAEGAVGRIQRALAERGYLEAHREGELDAPTSAALRRFQEDEGLAETGFPDRETLRRLHVDPEKAYGRAGDAPR